MRTWRLVAAAIFGACLLASAAPAGADDGVRLTATAGWAGRCHTGRPIVVRARIAADRLVSGVLLAESTGAPAATTEVPVEVAGGSEKEVVLVASSPFGCDGVLVKLREANTETTTRIGASDAGDTVLLGLLPGALRGQAVQTSARAMTGVAAVAPVDVELLDRAGAIDGLDSIGLTTSDLDGLSAGQRGSLAAWIARGGTLLVDTDDPTRLGALPEAWRPAAGGRVRAGQGQVRLTGAALREGRIDGLAEPSAASTASRVLAGPVDLTTLLQEQSGLRVLSLPIILGALVLYVALVGPGARIGLRRLGQVQLTWLLVPLTAVGFTGLAVAGGDVLRRGGKPTHVSVIESAAAGSPSRTFVGVPTRDKGSVVANLPAGWFSASQGSDEMSRRSILRATPTGHRLLTPGRPGGFVLLGAEGPSPVEGRLRVELAPDGGGGTVRNDLEVPLEDVALFAPGGAVALGHLDPGASAGFATPSGMDGTDAFSLAHNVWDVSREGLADPNVFASVVDVRDPFGAGLGMVAIGWTDAFESPVDVRGSRPSGTTLVLGRPDDGPPSAVVVGSTNSGRLTTRFVVPEGAAYRLSLHADRFAGPFPGGRGGFGQGMPVEVLAGGRWVQGFDGSLLPADASAGGVVYVRTTMQMPVLPTLEPA